MPSVVTHPWGMRIRNAGRPGSRRADGIPRSLRFERTGGIATMTRKLRRRLRVIAARVTVCAVMVAAMGATGWRTQADVDAAEATQASLLAH